MRNIFPRLNVSGWLRRNKQETTIKTSDSQDRVEAIGYPGIFYKFFILSPIHLTDEELSMPEISRFAKHLGKTKSVEAWNTLGIDLTENQTFQFRFKKKKITFSFLPVPDERANKETADTRLDIVQKENATIGERAATNHA